MSRIATYYYPEATITLTMIGNELVLTDEYGRTPYAKALRCRHAMDTSSPVGVSVPTYDVVGLFYGYTMPGIGWS